jgi:sec-independent protein translocase protein TatA
MPHVGPMELILVLVALLFLGPKRLPSAARSLSEGLRGFKETLTDATGSPSQVAEGPGGAADAEERAMT